MDYKQAWNSLKRDIEVEIINFGGRGVLDALVVDKHINLQTLPDKLKSCVIVYIYMLEEENVWMG